jgi:hypothetical protein
MSDSTTNPAAAINNAASPAVVTSAERDLLFDDLLMGGDDAIQAVTIDGINKNGGPGVVYFRQLSAREVFEFAEMPGETPAEIKERNEKPFNLLARALVDRTGKRLLTDEQVVDNRVMDMPLPVLTKLTTALMKSLGIVATEDEIAAAAAKAKDGESESAKPNGKGGDDGGSGTPLGKG